MSVYEKLLELENQLKDMKKEIKQKEELIVGIEGHALFPFYQSQLLCQPLEYKHNQNSMIWALSTMIMILVDFYDKHDYHELAKKVYPTLQNKLIVKHFRLYFPTPTFSTEVRRFKVLAREEYGIIKPIITGVNSRVVLTEHGESLKKQLIQFYLRG